MEALEKLLSNLEDFDALDRNRREIIKMIRDLLDREGDRLTEDQKIHLSNSIGSLSLNVNAISQPTTAWLRLCLNDLQKAIDHKQPRIVRSHAGSAAFGKSDLVAAIESIERHLPEQTED